MEEYPKCLFDTNNANHCYHSYQCSNCCMYPYRTVNRSTPIWSTQEIEKAVDKRTPDGLEKCPDILKQADDIVNGERQEDYGSPLDNMTRIASFWSEIVGVEVTPYKAALMMAALKLARECAGYKVDNLVDMAGYIQIAGICKENEAL